MAVMDFKNFKINRSAYASASEQLEDYIRSEIASKGLQAGYRIPNTSDIVKKVSVGAATVRQAMGNLVREGLIESKPGKGTFVSEQFFNGKTYSYADDVNNGGDHQMTIRLGIVGALAGESESMWYRQQTITGIVKQCDIFGIELVIISNRIKSNYFEEVKKVLCDARCDAFIWLYPIPEEWEMIEKLQEEGISIVVTRYSHGNDDLPSVELDTDQAGFDVGAYFVKKECSKVLMFSSTHTDATSRNAMKHGCWPHNIYFGLERSFRCLRPELENPLENDVVGAHYRKASERIHNKLTRFNEEAGLFFGDSIQMVHYLNTYGQKARDMLRDRVLVSTSNNSSLAALAASNIDFDIKTITFPYETIGLLSVQKAKNLILGHLNGTATLLRLPFKDYDSNNYVNSLVEELNSRSEKLKK
jgi:DNA-binding transcriptional regulator YhcF (GntR family)